MIRFSSATLLVAGSALALSACVPATTSGPVSSAADPNANARRGALIGGLSGAVIGATAEGDDVRGALIGGAVGAAAGGALGARLDAQEAALRAQLSSNVGIVNNGQQLIVTMPQDILFATDSAQLSGSLQSDLGAVARSLNEYPQSRVTVIGHADNTGTAAYNQDLSERRARSVANVLVANGVSSGRVSAVGRGEDQPIASNLTPEGRQQNRRVDIVISPY